MGNRQPLHRPAWEFDSSPPSTLPQKIKKMSHPGAPGRHTYRNDQDYEAELLHNIVRWHASGIRVGCGRDAFVFVHRVRSDGFLSCCCPDLRQGACVGHDRTVVARSGVRPCSRRRSAPGEAGGRLRDALDRRGRRKVTPKAHGLGCGKTIPSELHLRSTHLAWRLLNRRPYLGSPPDYRVRVRRSFLLKVRRACRFQRPSNDIQVEGEMR
jgi:hypothetical protein